jgi:arylsulfatase A-like enzyme/predicted alpha/beta superfamily hydrolase
MKLPSPALPCLLLFCTAFVFCPVLRSSAIAAERPNIVLIISDDQAWNDYGFMGHETIKTPNLDQLAAESVVFERGYVPTGLCRPSLMTLVTGLYAHQHKTTGNDPSPAVTDRDTPAYNEQREKLISHIDRHPTVPRILSKLGYVSHQSGKWWEGSYQRGGFTAGMTRGFPERGGRHGDDGLKIGREGMKPVFDFVDEAVGDDNPFFLWYAPFMPHTPHNPPERILKKYQSDDRPLSLAKYYAMCEWFDETCGQLVDYLDEKKVRDNTLIVYVSDNGWIQRHPDAKVPKGWKSSFAPKSKQSPYEGGVRSPILFSWPGTIEPKKRAELVSSIDLVPTMLSAAGADVPRNLPGLDLIPAIRDGENIDRDTLFGESFAHDIADIEDPEASLLYRWCIEGRWKLLLTYDGAVNRYAKVQRRGELEPQLFDLLADPTETKNLATANAEVVERLAKKIDSWWPAPNRKVYGSTAAKPEPKRYEHTVDSTRQEGVPQGKVTEHVWKNSKIFSDTIRRYWTYAPAQYDPAKPAAVMVFQDGHAYVGETGDFRVPVVFDNLIHRGEMPITIGVFIDPGHKEAQLPAEAGWRPRPVNRSFEYDSLNDDYAKFLLTEILPEVGKSYNITDDPEGHAIGGISSGGICAFTAAWERPDQFRKVLSHVGSFTNIRGGHVYPALIRKTEPKPIRVFLQDGSNDLDNAHGNWPLSNLQMDAALKFSKYDYKFVYGEGAHNGNHGGAILPDSLRWLWRGYELP